METHDSIEKRGTVLEDAFFHRVDAELIEKMRAAVASETGRHKLAAACPWASDEELTALSAANITPESLMSLMLVPLVRVAWADGRVELNERKALLQAAHDNQCAEGSLGYETLQSWLDEEPPQQLFEAWKHYVQSLRQTLEADAVQCLQQQIVSRARAVARAAGGVLGVLAISSAEEVVLQEIESAFA